MFEDASGTTVSRLMQVPQYVILTAAEVMFSVTGLSFAYSQVSAHSPGVNGLSLAAGKTLNDPPPFMLVLAPRTRLPPA